MSAQQFKILYFAQVAERLEKREETWPLNQPLNVAGLIEQLCNQYPQLAPLKLRLQVAINQEHAAQDAPINAHDEVAVFEPVTGG